MLPVLTGLCGARSTFKMTSRGRSYRLDLITARELRRGKRGCVNVQVRGNVYVERYLSKCGKSARVPMREMMLKLD